MVLRRESSRARRAPLASAAVLTAVFALVATACGADDGTESESTQELLEELEGRPLSPAEVAERTEVADLLCGLDDPVLMAVWDELTPSDFEFQDIVFSRTCPERLSLYAGHTGRFVVEDPDAEG